MKTRTETPPIRVIIADDHPVIREGLAAIFRSQKNIKAVAEAANNALRRGNDVPTMPWRHAFERRTPRTAQIDLG
jgi:DNA-binding NarL/FixJ family response regulator